MYRLYDFPGSGNGYKVRLLMALLETPYTLQNLDILKGETRTPEFLALNPAGKIPTLVRDDGRVLAESNAILFYLADGTSYLPDDSFARAQVLQWMFFEQYGHEPYLAVVRFWRHFLEMTPEREAQLPEKMDKGYQALGVMEQRLTGHDWLVGDSFTIADIALYAYTHVADEGGFDLHAYLGINAWMARIRAISGYIGMDG